MIHNVSLLLNLMEHQTAFKTLGELIDRYESDGRSVECVEAVMIDMRHGMLRATVGLRIPFHALLVRETNREVTSKEATLTDDGTIEFSWSIPPLSTLPTAETDAVSVTEEELQVRDDHLYLTVEVAVETAGQRNQQSEMAGGTSVTDGAAAANDTATADGGIEDDTSLERDEYDTSLERDESVPPYEDTEYLRALYQESDSFAEMSRRIVMDVSSETVRRYMIEAGIHEPNTYDTTRDDDSGDDVTGGTVTDNGDERSTNTDEGNDENDGGETADRVRETKIQSDVSTDDETVPPFLPAVSGRSSKRVLNEQLAGEGAALPDGVRVEDVADAVVDSVTVYEVQQHLGLDRDQARSLLADLNLLDLVARQISALDRTVSYDLVADRLREGTPSGA